MRAEMSCRKPISRSPSIQGFGFGDLIAEIPFVLDATAARPIAENLPALLPPTILLNLLGAIPKGKSAFRACPTLIFNGRYQFAQASSPHPVSQSRISCRIRER